MKRGSSNKSDAMAKSSRRNEIVIAIIGLLGVLATAFFSNFDKIFPPANLVSSSYSGYTPTEEPLVEARMFLVLTGKYDKLGRIQEAFLPSQRKYMIEKAKLTPEQSAEMMQLIENELKRINQEITEENAKITSKYFSVSQLQQLNKFYSTPIMRQMQKKQPLIDKEYGKLLALKIEELQEKMQQKYNELNNPIGK